jgi:hypothetical protein
VQVELRDTGDLKAVVRALRAHADGKQLRRELSAGMRQALAPAVPQVRAAYRAEASRTIRRFRGGPSLRSLLASATRAEVRTSGRLAGARIRVDGRRMPPGMRALPKAYEGAKRWRHPVFGDRETWVAQEPHPTFYRTAAAAVSEAQAVEEINRVVGRILQRIERAR